MIALYFQAVQGVTAVQAGIKILPLLLSSVIMSIVSGGLITVVGYYSAVVIPCTVLFAVGCGMLTTFDTHSPTKVWFGYQVLAGLGVGPGFQVGVLIVQTVLPQEWVPVGSACAQFFQALGGAVSIAISQTVFQNGLIDKINEDNIGIDPQIFINNGANQIRHVLEQLHRSDAYETVLEAYMKGLRNTYYLAAVASTLACITTICFEWKSVKKTEDASSQPGNSTEKTEDVAP